MINKTPQIEFYKSCFCLSSKLLVSISWIVLMSCNGQEKKPAPKITYIVKSNSGNTSTNQDYYFQANAIPNENLVPLYYEGQLCHWVRDIIQDTNGDLWFATNHYGAMRYNGDSLMYFMANEGFGGNQVRGITQDKAGNVWFGTSQGITKYDPTIASEKNPFTNYTTDDGLVHNEVWSIMIDRNDVIWIGTEEGISSFDGTAFTTLQIPRAEVKDAKPRISKNRISTIIEDKQGVLWFGTDGYGICKYDPMALQNANKNKFTLITKKEGLCDNMITDLFEDSKGQIWIGTMYGGLSKYDGKSFTNYTQEGLIKGIEVGAIYEDKNNHIWFAAEHQGIYSYNPSLEAKGANPFRNLNKTDGLESEGIISIFEDKDGRFWLGGWKGLFRYNPLAKNEERTFFNITKSGPWD